MTNKEIKKALECCMGLEGIEGCKKCPYFPTHRCNDSLCKDALTLIIKKEKEIERLKAEIEYKTETIRNAVKISEGGENEPVKIRKETAREFAEKLKETVLDYLGVKTIEEADKLSLFDSTLTYGVVTDRIDELLKEYEE